MDTENTLKYMRTMNNLVGAVKYFYDQYNTDYNGVDIDTIEVILNPPTYLNIKKTNKWLYRVGKVGEFQEATEQELVTFLLDKKVPLDQFNSALIQSLTSIAVSYTLTCNDIRKAIGDDLYDEGIKSWEEFGKKLSATIDSYLHKSKLKVVE